MSFTFFIPFKKCCCKDLQQIVITLFNDRLICSRSYKVYHYIDNFTIVLGYLLLKKFNKNDTDKFLEHFPWFKDYDYKWIWQNLKAFSKFIDENRSCFLRILGLPVSFIAREFIFDDNVVNLMIEKAKKKRDYKFTNGEPVKLGEIPKKETSRKTDS